MYRTHQTRIMQYSRCTLQNYYVEVLTGSMSALRLVLEKYLRTSLALALAASRRVLYTPDLTPQHSTAACTQKLSANKKIYDGPEVPKKKKKKFLQEKLNIINKYDAGITNVI